MSTRSLVCIFLAAVFLLPVSALCQDTGGSTTSTLPLPAGTPVPSFSLPDILGTQVDVGDYIGKVPVILSFWSIYCDSCVEEMLSLQKLEDKYRGDGLVIIAVNEDIRVPKSRIRRFLDRLERFRGEITYPLLYDEDSKVFNTLGVPSLPTLVLVDRQGRVSEYSHGFDPEDERELLAGIEALVRNDGGPVVPDSGQRGGKSTYITVSGEAALCGFFDATGWRKSFTGSDSLQMELELTRDLSRRAATRNTISEALRMLGIKLYSSEVADGCITPNGINLSRDPFDTKDPTSNLLSLVNYSDFFETLHEQEKLIDKTYYTTRRVRVLMEDLSDELGSLGYLFEPLRITFTYVNMSSLDQKAFLAALLDSSRYIGRFESPVTSASATTQVFEVYTSSQGFADEILGIDFGDLQVFVEEVTPASLELEVWK